MKVLRNTKTGEFFNGFKGPLDNWAPKLDKYQFVIFRSSDEDEIESVLKTLKRWNDDTFELFILNLTSAT